MSLERFLTIKIRCSAIVFFCCPTMCQLICSEGRGCVPFNPPRTPTNFLFRSSQLIPSWLAFVTNCVSQLYTCVQGFVFSQLILVDLLFFIVYTCNWWLMIGLALLCVIPWCDQILKYLFLLRTVLRYCNFTTKWIHVHISWFRAYFLLMNNCKLQVCLNMLV